MADEELPPGLKKLDILDLNTAAKTLTTGLQTAGIAIADRAAVNLQNLITQVTQNFESVRDRTIKAFTQAFDERISISISIGPKE